MAACLQEVVYCTTDAADRAISESLYFIRGEEEIEDEEDIGGLQRPWLSQFEFIKVFSATPALNFLSWMELWYFLPSMEKVVHHVRCAVCGVKNITGFRYQCTQCNNYIMCEMCFLKGRIDEPHQLDHQVLECLDYTKSLKSRFSTSKTKPHSKSCRVMSEPCELPLAKESEYQDGSVRPTDLPMSSSPESTPEHSLHTPTIIRIGSNDSLGNSAHRLSMSSLGSVESHGSSYIERSHSPNIGETGARRPTPIIPSIRQRASSTTTRFTSPRISEGMKKGKTLPRLHTGDNLRHIVLHKVASDSCMLTKSAMDDEFADINERLSMEVDTLMQELLPELDEANLTRSVVEHKNLKEEQEVVQLQREKLSGEVASLLAQVNKMHNGFVGMKKGVKPLMEPVNLLDQSSPVHLSHASSTPILQHTIVC